MVPQKDICERNTQEQTKKKRSSSVKLVLLDLSVTVHCSVRDSKYAPACLHNLYSEGAWFQESDEAHVTSHPFTRICAFLRSMSTDGGAEVWEDSTTTQACLVSLWTAVTVSPLTSCRFSAFPPVRSHNAAAVFFHDAHLRLFLIPE